MIKIYHNPRCRKSREGLELLEASGQEFEIIKYLDDTLSEEELTTLIKLLGISAEQLVRKGESIWKEQYRGKALTESEVVKAMVLHPKLIERPIVVNGEKAVIGRPKENIEGIL